MTEEDEDDDIPTIEEIPNNDKSVPEEEKLEDVDELEDEFEDIEEEEKDFDDEMLEETDYEITDDEIGGEF